MKQLYFPFLILMTFLPLACIRPIPSGGGYSKPDISAPVIVTKFKGNAFPQIFEAAYLKGTKAEQGKLQYEFDLQEIGNLKIESGKIIAGDPIFIPKGLPFAHEFPKGEFPVQLAIAKENDDARVGYVRIYFSNNEVIRWELALQPGQKQRELRDSMIYCYGVDGGVGLFIDSLANSAFESMGEQNLFSRYAKELGRYDFTGLIHNFGGHNLAIFRTGYGDGCYPSYIGYDNKGNICRLLTDFELVQWQKL